jgi:hypothetical protein
MTKNLLIRASNEYIHAPLFTPSRLECVRTLFSFLPRIWITSRAFFIAAAE